MNINNELSRFTIEEINRVLDNFCCECKDIVDDTKGDVRLIHQYIEGSQYQIYPVDEWSLVLAMRFSGNDIYKEAIENISSTNTDSIDDLISQIAYSIMYTQCMHILKNHSKS